MKKITTLFKRDFSNNGIIYDEYSDGVEWVVNGEGTATRKYDGTSCLVRGGKMYKRYEYKDGKTPPTDFEEADYDQETGKHVGWVEVGWGSEDKWHRDTPYTANPDKVKVHDGYFELVGPKVQGNPEHLDSHMLVQFAGERPINSTYPLVEVLEDVPVTFNGLRDYLADKDIEGIVWHHPDGRMAKIKGKDYRLKRQNIGERHG
jgi:hypothetical protein